MQLGWVLRQDRSVNPGRLRCRRRCPPSPALLLAHVPGGTLPALTAEAKGGGRAAKLSSRSRANLSIEREMEASGPPSKLALSPLFRAQSRHVIVHRTVNQHARDGNPASPRAPRAAPPNTACARSFRGAFSAVPAVLPLLTSTAGDLRSSGSPASEGLPGAVQHSPRRLACYLPLRVPVVWCRSSKAPPTRGRAPVCRRRRPLCNPPAPGPVLSQPTAPSPSSGANEAGTVPCGAMNLGGSVPGEVASINGGLWRACREVRRCGGGWLLPHPSFPGPFALAQTPLTSPSRCPDVPLLFPFRVAMTRPDRCCAMLSRRRRSPFPLSPRKKCGG